MSRETVSTDRAPAAIGPYSQGIVISADTSLAFLSGQIALDPASGQLVTGGVEAETHQVMKNIGAILDQLGEKFDSVIKTTIFLKDLADFSHVNQIYGEYFRHNPPARSTVEVSRLPREANIEIECIVGLKKK